MIFRPNEMASNLRNENSDFVAKEVHAASFAIIARASEWASLSPARM